MTPGLDNPWSQDLSDYTPEEQQAIQNLIQQDAQTIAQYFTKQAGDSPAQVIGASGFSGGINMAVSPATGPI